MTSKEKKGASEHPGAIPRDGRLDPAKIDVTAKPRRQRRNRKLPEPDAELRGWEAAALARAKARPHPPGIILEPDGFEKERWTAPHNDVDLWALQLADAFATRSRAVMVTFMSQLQALCGRDFWDEEAREWRLDENEFSAIIAIVNSVKPRNELEAALVAQMVGVHLLTMKITARALHDYYDTKTAAVAGKLARTFAIQLEALRANRGKPRTSRQSITVRKDLQQHVHYHDHRGEPGNDRQPHGRAIDAVDECTALPSQQSSGKLVPLSGRQGKARV